MRLFHAVALLALLPGALAGKVVVTGRPSPAPTFPSLGADGFAAGACLDARYQFHAPTAPLTCDNQDRAWTHVHLTAAPSCIEGRRLTIEGLRLDLRFRSDVRDFAVRASRPV